VERKSRRRKHHGKYIILHGSASTITALLLVVYGWKASRVLSAYMRVETGHFWFSAHQAAHIQPLFMLAVLAGIVQQFPYLVERWLWQGDDNVLHNQEKVGLPYALMGGCFSRKEYRLSLLWTALAPNADLLPRSAAQVRRVPLDPGLLTSQSHDWMLPSNFRWNR